MKRRKRLNSKSRRAYVEGLKKYQAKGVPVLIDGKEADDTQWDKIFEIREDGSFYMGDYILEDEPEQQEEQQPEQPEQSEQLRGQVLCETPAQYSARKRLKEIRFEIVYNK